MLMTDELFDAMYVNKAFTIRSLTKSAFEEYEFTLPQLYKLAESKINRDEFIDTKIPIFKYIFLKQKIDLDFLKKYQKNFGGDIDWAYYRYLSLGIATYLDILDTIRRRKLYSSLNSKYYWSYDLIKYYEYEILLWQSDHAIR